MVLLKNSNEGGTDGTTISTSNSGGASGDAWHGGLGTVTFSNEQAAHGSMSLKVASAGTNQGFMAWAWTDGDRIAARWYYMHTVSPSVAYQNVTLATAASNTAGQVQVTGTNRFLLTMSGPGTIWSSTNPLSANNWYRAELLIDRATSFWRFAYYGGDSTVPIEDASGTSGTAFTTAIGQIRFGKASSGSFTSNLYYDEMAVDTEGTSFLGPATTGYNTSQFFALF